MTDTVESTPKIVRRTVMVTDPETEKPVTFVDGDELPAWAAELVTNPAVFEAPEETSLGLPVGSERTGVRFRSEYVDANGDLVVRDSDKRLVRTPGL